MNPDALYLIVVALIIAAYVATVVFAVRNGIKKPFPPRSRTRALFEFLGIGLITVFAQSFAEVAFEDAQTIAGIALYLIVAAAILYFSIGWSVAVTVGMLDRLGRNPRLAWFTLIPFGFVALCFLHSRREVAEYETAQFATKRA